MSQQEVADKFGVSEQAVSKWENGQNLSDVEMLSRIAEIMHVSMETLAGFPYHYHVAGHYETQYRKEEYFWGVNPSGMCRKILELMPPDREDAEILWKSGEILTEYCDWLIEDFWEEIRANRSYPEK